MSRDGESSVGAGGGMLNWFCSVSGGGGALGGWANEFGRAGGGGGALGGCANGFCRGAGALLGAAAPGGWTKGLN
jgi:hypothetical protein